MSNLNDIFAKAAEIAQKLPENLQVAAFNRALDELLNGTVRRPSVKNRGNSQRSAKSKLGPNEIETESFLDDIDRTKYPDIGDTNRVADQALKVLQLVREDCDIDGLTAPQISEILVKIFRLSATSNAVRVALQRESRTVNVRSGPDGKKTFHLMAPGDDYLESLRAGETVTQTHRRKKTVKKKAKERSTGHKKTANKKQASRKVAKRRSTTLGPKAAVEKLAETDFFSKSRKILEIQEELKHNKGHTFSVQELSSALVRCVRDETLSRSRGESGHYEYSKA